VNRILVGRLINTSFLIEQVSKPMEIGLIMPNVKQCMQLVRAWNKVSEDSIINCQQKCQTLKIEKK